MIKKNIVVLVPRGSLIVWRVVYIASNHCTAESIKGILTGEGFLVIVRPTGAADGIGILFEVLVPQSEVEEAHEAISQLLLSRAGQGENGQPG